MTDVAGATSPRSGDASREPDPVRLDLDLVGDRDDAIVVPGLVARMRTLLPALQPADRRVAEYVVGHPEQVVLASVSDVALAAGTSAATVVRLCQKLGLRGFQHLKIVVARDLAPRGELRISQLTASSTPSEILETVARTGIEGLTSIGATLDVGQFADAVRAISAARRILVTGVGSSAAVAQDVAYRLTTIGLEAEAPADSHHQHLRARLLRPGDVLVAISASGATSETVESARAAAKAGATAIAITGYRRSPLADIVEIALVAGSSQLLALRTESMATRLVHLAVLDAIVAAVALAREDRASAALDAVDDVASRHRY